LMDKANTERIAMVLNLIIIKIILCRSFFKFLMKIEKCSWAVR